MKPIVLAVALVGICAFAQADSLRAQIEASNKVIATAMLKKDFATLERVIKGAATPNFTYTEAGHTESIEQMMQQMKGGLGMMKLSSCGVKLLSLKEGTDKATALEQHAMVGTVTGPDKKSHKMSFTGVAVTEYAKLGGKWKMASMRWKSQKQTMDGKPLR